MTIAEATAIHSEVELLSWNERTIAEGVTQATAAFVSGSPQVSPAADAPGVWWIGASGVDGLGGERALLRSLIKIGRFWHPRPRAAIADSCVAAYAATCVSSQDLPSRIVPSGGCARFLSSIPLSLIPMDPELRETLFALGLRTAGAFARLECKEVEARWGHLGLEAWQLARGADLRRPVLAQPERPYLVGLELPMPTDSLDPVLFLTRAAVERLTAEVLGSGEAIASLTITLTLDDARTALPAQSFSGRYGNRLSRRVVPARPLARSPLLFEQCRIALRDWNLSAPVVGVAVSVTGTARLSAEQGDLLRAKWQDSAMAELTLSRLRAVLGADSVVRPRVRDAHVLEHDGEWVEGGWDGQGRRGRQGIPAVGAKPAASTASTAPIAFAASLRLLDSPEAIDIERLAHRPSVIRWRGQRLQIVKAVGPERLSGDWWQGPYSRDYWRCESNEGDLVIFLDRIGEQKWYLQGWYD